MKNYLSKMEKSVLSFKKDISTLRTGRANTSMLDTIKVDVYGQARQLQHLDNQVHQRLDFYSSLG